MKDWMHEGIKIKWMKEEKICGKLLLHIQR